MIAALGLFACDRDKDRERANDDEPNVQVSTTLPTYTVPRELEQEYPELVAFLKQFVETCYAGDYAGYRQMVARSEDPESRHRFEAIIRAIDTIVVESIRPLEEGQVPRLAGPLYLVETQVDFKPESRVALRSSSRRLAIIALQENGEWRMAPAPASLQPRDSNATTQAAQTQPAETTYFPWDTGGGK